MARPRLAAAVTMLVVGLPLVVIVGGGQVPGCLGPIGVTWVECYRATGRTPGVGPGPLAAGVLILGAMALLVFDTLGRSPLPWAAIGIGAVCGAVIYATFRPTAMEGFTASGEWVSLPLPLDASGVVGAALLAGALCLGLVVLVEGAMSRGRSGARHGPLG